MKNLNNGENGCWRYSANRKSFLHVNINLVISLTRSDLMIYRPPDCHKAHARYFTLCVLTHSLPEPLVGGKTFDGISVLFANFPASPASPASPANSESLSCFYPFADGMLSEWKVSKQLHVFDGCMWLICSEAQDRSQLIIAVASMPLCLYAELRDWEGREGQSFFTLQRSQFPNIFVDTRVAMGRGRDLSPVPLHYVRRVKSSGKTS